MKGRGEGRGISLNTPLIPSVKGRGEGMNKGGGETESPSFAPSSLGSFLSYFLLSFLPHFLALWKEEGGRGRGTQSLSRIVTEYSSFLASFIPSSPPSLKRVTHARRQFRKGKEGMTEGRMEEYSSFRFLRARSFRPTEGIRGFPIPSVH